VQHAERDQVAVGGVWVMLPALRNVVAEALPMRTRSSDVFGTR
jgi:hypothetical protein